MMQVMVDFLLGVVVFLVVAVAVISIVGSILRSIWRD